MLEHMLGFSSVQMQASLGSGSDVRRIGNSCTA